MAVSVPPWLLVTLIASAFSLVGFVLAAWSEGFRSTPPKKRPPSRFRDSIRQSGGGSGGIVLDLSEAHDLDAATELAGGDAGLARATIKRRATSGHPKSGT
jgi:hypothetical protein